MERTNPEKSRLLWMDGIRCFAFLIVFTWHYFQSFFPQEIPVQGIGEFLIHGITGKAAVALFCVILGYFAADSTKKYTFSSYTVRRYLYFMTHMLVTNLLVVVGILFFTLWQPELNSIFVWSSLDLNLLWQWFFRDVLFFSYHLVPTFWCMADFFLASVIIFLVQKEYNRSTYSASLSIFAVLFVTLCLSMSGTWIAICLLGAVLWILNDLDLPLLKKRRVLLLLTVVMFFLYRLPNYSAERYSDYLLWGMSGFLFLVICFRVTIVKRILSIPFFAYLGKYSFELYLCHVIIMNGMGLFLAAGERLLPYPVLLLAGYISCLGLSLLLALGIQRFALGLQLKIHACIDNYIRE